MDFLEQLLGINLDVTTRTMIAFAVVLVLIVLIAWIFRRLSSGGARAGRRGRIARLAVLEAVAVDQRRRLVLLRRDNTEHLILIGGGTDLVIEQGIHRTPRQPAARAGERVGERREPQLRQVAPARQVEPPPTPQPTPPPTPQPAPSRVAPVPSPVRGGTSPAHSIPPARPTPPMSTPASSAPPIAAPTSPSSPPAAPPSAPASAAPDAPEPEATEAATDKAATERQLAQMADRLKAALRQPATDGEPGEGGEKPDDGQETDTYKNRPATPTDTREPE